SPGAPPGASPQRRSLGTTDRRLSCRVAKSTGGRGRKVLVRTTYYQCCSGRSLGNSLLDVCGRVHFRTEGSERGVHEGRPVRVSGTPGSVPTGPGRWPSG